MKAIFLALMTALLPLAATSQTTDDSVANAALIEANAPESIVAALQKLGYRAELTTDPTGDPQIKSAAGGVNFSVYFYGCKQGKACRSIQFSAGFNTEDGVELAVANDWNMRNRFGKVYLDDERDPFIEQDITMAGGMTDEMFADNLRFWELVISDFKKHIDW